MLPTGTIRHHLNATHKPRRLRPTICEETNSQNFPINFHGNYWKLLEGQDALTPNMRTCLDFYKYCTPHTQMAYAQVHHANDMCHHMGARQHCGKYLFETSLRRRLQRGVYPRSSELTRLDSASSDINGHLCTSTNVGDDGPTDATEAKFTESKINQTRSSLSLGKGSDEK